MRIKHLRIENLSIQVITSLIKRSKPILKFHLKIYFMLKHTSLTILQMHTATLNMKAIGF